MASAPPHEQTPLLAGTSKTSELADQSLPRPYKKQNRCFHIIVTAAITFIVALAIGVTVYFLFLKGNTDNDPVSLYKKIVGNDAGYNDNDLNVLLQSSWPRMDSLAVSYPASSYITIIEEAVDEGKEKLKKTKSNDTQSGDDDSNTSQESSSTTEGTEKESAKIMAARMEGSTTSTDSSTSATSKTTSSTDDTSEEDSSSSDTTSKLSDYGYIENEATKYLRDKKHIPGVIYYNATNNLKWTNETGCFRLAKNITCETGPYRTADGFCNNMHNPWWGVARRPFRRALPADYADGLSAPRGDFNSQLPSALDVRAGIAGLQSDHKKFNEMLSIWGQFIDHDISIVASYANSYGDIIDCCLSENKSVECFPVIKNSTEEQNNTCFDFIRSLPALRCSFGPREQLNEVSSFLDGSLIYGNNEYLSAQLRSFENGLLDQSHDLDGDIWIPPIRAAVGGYNPESSRRTFYDVAHPWQEGSWRSQPSYNPVGAWKPMYDPDGPWKLSYNPEGQWREMNDRKGPWRLSHDSERSSKSSSNAEGSSWRSFYEKQIPWGTENQEEFSRLKRSAEKSNEKKQWNKKKYYSPIEDFRPSEYAQVAAMRAIIARQHNSIAKTLRALHPDWNDEIIFQETKRIVTAQMQHITYKEFLPHILGEEMMQRLKLYPRRKGYWTGYNKSIDSTVSNHFAVATSKLSQAAIEKLLARKSAAKEWEEEIVEEIEKNENKIESDIENVQENIKNETDAWYKQPLEMIKGNIDSLVKGILGNNNSTSDNSTEASTEASTESSSVETVTSSSTSSTTESTSSSTEAETKSEDTKRDKRSPSRGRALDSTSYNIQRGRDHGLPSYTEWRKYCNLSEVKFFNDLKPIFYEDALQNISQLYRSVYDIDLYTGALAEKPIPGSLVGPTSACLLADQYYRMKYGDRYWYETNEKPQAFTSEQLDEIRKTSLSGILCANIEHLTYIPSHIMWTVDENNKYIACSDIEQPNMSHWSTSTEYDPYDYNANTIDVKKGEANEVEREFHRFKPYLDKLDIKVNSSGWTVDDSLPSYVADWISNRSSNVDTVLKHELSRLNQVPRKGGMFSRNSRLPGMCNVTAQTRHVEIYRNHKQWHLQAPREILVNVLHDQMLVWSPNASDSLTYGFKIVNKTGNFNLDFEASYNQSNCLELKPECIYYSKVVLGDLVDTKDLFEVSVSTVADTCSVIAPVLLKGYYVDEDTFYWTGAITIYTNENGGLDKEEELSFYTSVRKDWLSLPRLNGTLTIRDHGKWDGHLPVVLDTSALSWYSTEDTLVYPVSWSGFYDQSLFEGVFLMPQKQGKKIKWYDGEFSINLPTVLPDMFKELIQKNRVYSSVVYLTSNPDGIGRFDVSEFNKIKDWVFVDHSQILIIGQFDEKGRFHWSGEISIHMSPPGIDYPSTTYRPYGKYLFKILEGELFSQLGHSGTVQKWWSGVLPSTLIIPSGEFDERLQAHILDQYVVWSFENYTATDGNGTFVMYTSRSQLNLWGSFEFQYAFLMDAVWTSTLKPNVTYCSPILLQYERMTFDFGDDMPERLSLAFQRPDLGILAPITLLGEFHNRTTFNWNSQILVTVIEK